MDLYLALEHGVTALGSCRVTSRANFNRSCSPVAISQDTRQRATPHKTVNATIQALPKKLSCFTEPEPLPPGQLHSAAVKGLAEMLGLLAALPRQPCVQEISAVAHLLLAQHPLQLADWAGVPLRCLCYWGLHPGQMARAPRRRSMPAPAALRCRQAAVRHDCPPAAQKPQNLTCDNYNSERHEDPVCRGSECFTSSTTMSLT